jgi:hypothetical protein
VRHTDLKNGCHFGPIPIRYIDVISLLVGLALTMAWWFTHKNWLISDILSICIVVSMIKVFKYTSLKIALLSYLVNLGIFIAGAVLPVELYGEDTYMYFLFKINNPFQLQLPTLSHVFSINCSWISITSIYLPGLLVAYLHRFDMSRATNIYLISSVLAYFLGSVIWNLVSAVTRAPVPFDAVCPPFVLLTLSFMAYNRKELRTIWEGTFYDE